MRKIVQYILNQSFQICFDVFHAKHKLRRLHIVTWLEIHQVGCDQVQSSWGLHLPAEESNDDHS